MIDDKQIHAEVKEGQPVDNAHTETKTVLSAERTPKTDNERWELPKTQHNAKQRHTQDAGSYSCHAYKTNDEKPQTAEPKYTAYNTQTI